MLACGTGERLDTRTCCETCEPFRCSSLRSIGPSSCSNRLETEADATSSRAQTPAVQDDTLALAPRAGRFAEGRAERPVTTGGLLTAAVVPSTLLLPDSDESMALKLVWHTLPSLPRSPPSTASSSSSAKAVWHGLPRVRPQAPAQGRGQGAAFRAWRDAREGPLSPQNHSHRQLAAPAHPAALRLRRSGGPVALRDALHRV